MIYEPYAIDIKKLPALEGTPKQIAWANDIRNAMVAMINDTLRYNSLVQFSDEWYDAYETDKPRTYSYPKMMKLLRKFMSDAEYRELHPELIKLGQAADKSELWRTINEKITCVAESNSAKAFIEAYLAVK